jgi:hypothetical protein
MANLQALNIAVPYDGLDTDSAPEAILETKAPVVANFLTDQPGRLPMRGPIVDTWPTSLAPPAGGKVVSVWKYNNELLVTYRKVDATRVREPWVAPYRKASADTILADVDLNLAHLNLDTGTVTAVATTGGRQPGGRGVRMGNRVYGLGYAAKSSTQSVDGGYVQARVFQRWDGGAVSPTSYTNGPFGAQALIGHYQRLIALGGTPPDLSTFVVEPNSLYWSDVVADAALADAAAAWQDDVSGLLNRIVVGAADGDFLVDAAHVGTNLAIFKRHAIYVMLGYSPSTWTVKPFTVEQGCIDPRSIVEYEDGCFFMSDRGFMYFDGSQLINTTQGVLRSSLVEAALAAVGDDGTDGGYVTASCLPNGYIGVSVGTAPSTTSGSVRTTTWAGMYHVARRTWSTLSCECLPSGATAPYLFGRTLNKSYAIDDARVVDTKALTVPERASAATRGFDRVNSVSTPILAKIQSKLVRLSNPLQRSQLHRFMLDSRWTKTASDQATSAAGDAWQVTLTDGNGTVLLPAYKVRSSSDTTTSYPYRRRDVRDVMSECNDLQVTVENAGSAAAITRAELLGATVEFQPTRLRPTE